MVWKLKTCSMLMLTQYAYSTDRQSDGGGDAGMAYTTYMLISQYNSNSLYNYSWLFGNSGGWKL